MRLRKHSLSMSIVIVLPVHAMAIGNDVSRKVLHYGPAADGKRDGGVVHTVPRIGMVWGGVHTGSWGW